MQLKYYNFVIGLGDYSLPHIPTTINYMKGHNDSAIIQHIMPFGISKGKNNFIYHNKIENKKSHNFDKRYVAGNIYMYLVGKNSMGSLVKDPIIKSMENALK